MEKTIFFIFSILVALSVASCVENRSSTDSRVTEIKDSRGQATSPQLSSEIAKPLVAQDQNMAPSGGYSQKSLFASGLHRRLAKEETGRVANVWNTEAYDPIRENIFHDVLHKPLSTFSIDVDTASYANVRRFINQGMLPPKDAVRIEELINYFSYEYPEPNGTPFSVTYEVATCPWNTKHLLLHVGLKGKSIPTESLPPSNLVFLIDVSGSMNSRNKLPLLKKAFSLLTEQLRAQDRVAIVVYAGAAGLVLPSTPGGQKAKVLEALERLQAGGSTAGGAGIELAYRVAKANFLESGNNRVILATDGDFNVGVSSDAAMVRLIEEKRKEGIFLTVLGFGSGNYKDSKMEKLADKGNGNYAYIDNILEAKKVLVNEIGATLLTIAKDVKIQIEFNPAKVKSYRLIGYENRLLRDEDFNDDRKDAGEIGAGHTVTALYEIVPTDSEEETTGVDPLKYQTRNTVSGKFENEMLTIKLRYKEPRETESKLMVYTVADKSLAIEQASANLRFSAAVAEFGMLLRDDSHRGQATFDHALHLAKGSRGKDENGYRAELVRLIETSKLLKGSS